MTRFDQARGKRVQQLADQYISEGLFSSIEWRVIHQGAVASEGALGFSQTSSAVPVYRIYSMTKPMVAMLALQLVEEQKLAFNTPIANVIPAFANVQVDNNGNLESLATPITIEHLLTHTGGFSYDFLPDCAVAAMYREAGISENAARSMSAYIDALAQLPLASQPGTQWRYSVSIDVLAHVLELITGSDLPSLLKTRLLDPLGMTDTAFSVNDSQISRLLPMYGVTALGEVNLESATPNKLDLMDVEKAYPSSLDSGFYRGGHGLYSTMDDYTRFLPVLFNGCSVDGEPLLSSPMVAHMWRNRIADTLRPLAIGEKKMMGYGWNLFGRVMLETNKAELLTSAGEGGWAGAASTYFWIDRANQFSGVVLAQYLGSTTALGPCMQHMAYQALVSD